MAYRSRTTRSSRGRSIGRRASYGRRPVATRRRRSTTARRSGGQTVRIVIEQPGTSLARPEIGVTQAGAPRKRKF